MRQAKEQGKAAVQLPVEVTAEDAKRTLGELLSRAGFGKERIAITRHGKRIAALVSAQDLERLDGAA
jgi:prevent-host-death family protein